MQNKTHQLVKLINELPYNQVANPKSYEGFLLDKEFITSLVSEIRQLNDFLDGYEFKFSFSQPEVIPYVHYEIYLTEEAFIKELTDSEYHFFIEEELDTGKKPPWPFQKPIFEEGKKKMREYYDQYKSDSYSDLKLMAKDLKQHLKNHNLELYGILLESIRDSTTPIRFLEELLNWIYGGKGNLEYYMYNIKSSLIPSNVDITEKFEANCDYLNKLRLEGSKIFFRIFLIQYLLKEKNMKKETKQLEIDGFLQDYYTDNKPNLDSRTINLIKKKIRDKANSISSKKTSSWRAETIYIYLETYIKNRSSTVDENREKAKRVLKEGVIYDEVDNVPYTTLASWRKKADTIIKNVNE